MRHYPQYFRAWEQQWTIAAHDVFTDANMHELVDSYLRPLGITSVLHAGIRLGGESIGVICVEHVGTFRHWSPEEQSVVVSLAGLVALAIEASDRVLAQETIQHSLREKEVLLKEVHHRVKNNLHIISNLLDLQSDRIQDQHLLSLFSDAQTRIQAMALIHEQLYQSDMLGQINFANYLQRLLENIFFSTHGSNHAIQPLILAEPVLLNLETAVPCGLLINELVTNALKHAFPTKQGSITIRLYQCEDMVHVVVQDDGIGLPDGFDWQRISSLGLKLVHLLAKQLRAELAIDGGQGVRVELKFSQLKYKSRF
jgi:two-component sensor histidine kinase